MAALPLKPGDPERLGAYWLIGRLGEGGQGVVYLGGEPGGDKKVAIKVLRDAATDPRARDRLAREIEAAMQVDEFCTAKVIDSSLAGPLPYIVSEYVPGRSLYDRVEESGPLSGGELTRLMISTAGALTAIHAAGVVHRDLKPSNVLLGPDGARVVDFGIARPAGSRRTYATGSAGQLMGTPAYFSPEQLRGHPATEASDVFAWAATMVYAATGQAPFGHADYETELPALFDRIRDDEPNLDGVPERALPLLRECLSKDPAQRPEASAVLSRVIPSKPANPSKDDDNLTKAAQRYLNNATPTPQNAAPTPQNAASGQQDTGSAPQSAAFVSQEGGSGRPVSVSERTPESAAGPEGPSSTPWQAPGPGVWHPGLPPNSPAPSADGPEFEPAPEPVGQDTLPPFSEETAKPGAGRRRARPMVAVAAVLLLAMAGLSGWLLFGGNGGGSGVPEWASGTWTGQVQEGNGIKLESVPISLTMTAGSKEARLTGGRCAGALELAKNDGHVLTFTFTSGSCESGELLVNHGGTGLGYDLRAGVVTGEGSLTRSG